MVLTINRSWMVSIKIRLPFIREVLNFYLKRKVSGSDPQLQTQQNDGNISTAQKASFAIANKLSPDLEKQGISKEMLWEYVKQKFNVEKRSDMTEMQWTQLAAELKAAQTSSELFDQLIHRIKL